MVRRPLKSILKREGWLRHYAGGLNSLGKALRGPLLGGLIAGFLFGGFFAGMAEDPGTALLQCSLMFGFIFSAYGVAFSCEFPNNQVSIIPPYKTGKPEQELWVYWREGDIRPDSPSHLTHLYPLEKVLGDTAMLQDRPGNKKFVPVGEVFLAGPQDLRLLEQVAGPAKPIVTNLYE
jgi:hypothetical protein